MKNVIAPSEQSSRLPADKRVQMAHTPSLPHARRSWRKAQWSLTIMLLPALLLLFIFSYLPLVGLLIAFKDYRAYLGLFESPWVGLDNFRFLFSTDEARQAVFNTLSLNALFIITSLLASVLLALLLNEVVQKHPHLTNFYQAVLFFPYLLSYVIVSYFVFAFLNADNGLLNHWLQALGLSPIDWYGSPQYWPAILTIIHLWKGVGFWTIVYFSGILAIDPEYYDAARIDGASKWQQAFYITLPFLLPLIVINVLLAIGKIMYADFGLFFQVTRNTAQLYPTTDVIDTFVYRSLTSLGDVGMAAAAGFYQTVIGFILVLLANWVVRRVDAQKALF
jgi:putative aldouronate transport system permease protein